MAERDRREEASVTKRKRKGEFQTYETPGGDRYAMVPMDEVDQMRSPDEKGIFGRVGARFRAAFGSSGKEAETTDTGRAQSRAGSGTMNDIAEMTTIEMCRHSKYQDYRKIDAECTELGRALSVTVNNVFASRYGDQDSYEVRGDDQRSIDAIVELDERVEMHSVMPGACKSMLLYGDNFEEVVVDEDFAVVRLKWLNPFTMYRHEDDYGRLDKENAFTQIDDQGTKCAEFRPWQVLHMRHDYQRGDLYGRSFFFHGRKPWRQIGLMEDGVIMNRLTKATDRFVYYVEIPKNADEHDAKRIVDQAKKDLKKRPLVDPNTGKLDLRKSPVGDDEDIFIGVYPDSPAKVERLGASGTTGELRDVEHFQNKMFMSTGVPKAYLGLERDVNAKATLQWEDVEYARILRGIQKEIAQAQRHVYNFQLALMGIVPEKESYKIVYPAISFVDEQIKMEIERMRWEIAVLARGIDVPLRWVLVNVVGLSDEAAEEVDLTREPQPAAGARPAAEDLADLRTSVFANARLARSVRDLRDMIAVVRSERLNKELVVDAKGAAL